MLFMLFNLESGMRYYHITHATFYEFIFYELILSRTVK